MLQDLDGDMPKVAAAIIGSVHDALAHLDTTSLWKCLEIWVNHGESW